MDHLSSLLERSRIPGSVGDYQSRTWSIKIQNDTQYPVQLESWPVRPTQESDPHFCNFRGVLNQTTSILPPNSILQGTPLITFATTRAPHSLDLRERWVWVYFAVVLPERKVHLQGFVKTSRKGLLEAKLGHLDLDSTESKPMASGEVGEPAKVDEHERSIVFIIDESVSSCAESSFAVKHVSRLHQDLALLSGKGIQTSTYVSSSGIISTVVVGNRSLYDEHHLGTGEIKTSDHNLEGIGRYVGGFVTRDGEKVWDAHLKVDAVDGAVKGTTLKSTSESTAVFNETATINYGFHDAGEGRRDQLYIYVTPNHSSWLGNLIKANPLWLTTRFSMLALPAAHDSGMFGPLSHGLAQLIQSGKLGHLITSHIEAGLEAPTVKYIVKFLEKVKLSPERVINNMALTQKDSFMDQLKIGVRFFDFRPGYCFHNVIKGEEDKGPLHHQHAIVPGCPYSVFLHDVLTFLSLHPSEIVVVELKSDGFPVKKNKYTKDGEISVWSMVPSVEELAQALDEGLKEAAVDIVIGGAGDLDRPIGELIESKTRFIVIDKIHDVNAWERGDSYDHVGYDTEKPSPILACLEKTFTESSNAAEPTPGKPLRGCIYQLQATPTANILHDVGASFTYSDCSSLLTFVKPIMDRATYPWLRAHEFKDQGNVVLLNDFVEGVLVEHAIAISEQRIQVL